jgi:hypothetical protein
MRSWKAGFRVCSRLSFFYVEPKTTKMKKLLMIVVLIASGSLICSAPTSGRANNELAKAYLVQMERKKQFDLFAEHLGLKESGNNWRSINQINCIGKWQFSPRTLKHLGYGHISASLFAQKPDLFPEDVQYQTLVALVKSNEMALKDYFHYIGQTIDGVSITKSGLLAGAHLSGPMGVKLWLTTGGKINRADANNTSVKQYLKEFQGYNF